MSSRYEQAYAAGVATAKAYKAGDTFIGALPEAHAQGFGASIERSIFMEGYLRNLARPIVIDSDSVILRIG
jgi:hypothetical protein